MYYLILTVSILTVFYLYRLLTSSSGSEFTDNSIDAFISGKLYFTKIAHLAIFFNIFTTEIHFMFSLLNVKSLTP